MYKTDMIGKDIKAVTGVVNAAYGRFLGSSKGLENVRHDKINKWTELARGLKASLDSSLGPHWHVLLGTHLGFAAKKRNQNMGIWRAGPLMLVVWRSPGREEQPEASLVIASAAPADHAAEPGRFSLRLAQPKSVAAGSSEEMIASAVKTELSSMPESDLSNMEKFAQRVRSRLLEDMGPIWHVIVGSEFAVEMADDRRNHVVMTYGKTRIVCFQHEQELRCRARVDWEKMFFRCWPWLLAVLVCFLGMALHMVCGGKEPALDRKWAWRLRGQVCIEGLGSNAGVVVATALVTSILARGAASFGAKARGQG